MVHKPQIVQAADAIAYLPLYIAEQSQIALELPDGSTLSWDQAFGEPFRNPPNEYLKGIKGEHKRTGDQGCLNSIRQAWESKVPLIGVCDPSNVVDVDDLVMVGGLISRACFWCLIDSDVPTSKTPEGLNVSHLFIHDRGFLTGHRIGDEVGKRLPNHGDGDPFIVDGSFDLLVDGAIWAKLNFADSAIAVISPSILSCVLAQDRGFRIAFAMHDLPEFREFLTTALVVHREALKLPNVRRALNLLVRALAHSQTYAGIWGKAVSEITRLCNIEGRFVSERRIDCASVIGHAVVPKKAPQGVQAPDVTDDQARQVWVALNSIYSPNCGISEAAWENAIRLSGKSKTGALPKLQDYFDSSILEESKSVAIVGEPTMPPLGLVDVWRNTAAWGRVRIVIALVAFAVAVLLITKVPFWVSGSAVLMIGFFFLWWRFPFRSPRLREFSDRMVVAIWWLLIVFIGLTFIAAVVVDWQKGDNGFTDVSKFVGTEYNGHWQRWAVKISTGWQATAGFLTAVFAALNFFVRGSRAARFLPNWVRKANQGHKR